ncbi:MAG: AI-2E family transporter [Myxococcota bacterium]
MSEAPQSDRAFIERSLRVGITVAVVLAAVFATLWVLKGALTPLAVAWFIAYLFDPVIDRFEARGVPRGPAILLLLVVAVTLAIGVGLFGIPALQRELAGLSQSLPGYADAVVGRVVPFLERTLGLSLPASVQDAIAQLRAGDIPIPVDAARAVLERTLSAVTGTVGAIVSLVIIPVLAYYLLVEFDRIRAGVIDLVPPAYQEPVMREARRVDTLISGFLRGQLTVCFLLGSLYAVGFAVIGIDLAFVIGMLAGAAAIIPYVGGALALASAGGMCLLQFGLDFHLALVVGWYAVCQGLEGFVLTPRIVGGSLGMHPVVVIVALMIGGDLLGFLGLMVAVPLAALVQVFLQDAVAYYRRSSLYGAAP